jgi:hypothetical protein
MRKMDVESVVICSSRSGKAMKAQGWRRQGSEMNNRRKRRIVVMLQRMG